MPGTRLEGIRKRKERRLRVVGAGGRVLEPVVEVDRVLFVALQTAENMAGMCEIRVQRVDRRDRDRVG